MQCHDGSRIDNITDKPARQHALNTIGPFAAATLFRFHIHLSYLSKEITHPAISSLVLLSCGS